MSDAQTTDTKMLFMQYVAGMMQSGMMQLGKIMNPMTQKVEKDLNGVKYVIDMLTMIRKKTEGNLDEDEQEILKNALSTLQLNYVDEVTHPASDGEDAEDEEGEEEDEGDEGGGESATTDEKGE